MNEESVHLSNWPKINNKKIDDKLEQEFQNAMKIIEMGLAERDKIQIGLKWPLAKITISTDKKLGKEILEIVSRQLNVKKAEIKNSKEMEALFDTKMTPELEAEGYAREISRQVQAFRKELGLKKTDNIELAIFCDDELRKMLEMQKKFVADRTNSTEIELFSQNVTTDKERFKKNIEFKIKDKRGKIGIIKK